MAKAVFEIEWPDDHGDGWMNIWNLMMCLTKKCPNTDFTVRGTDSEGSPIETSNRGDFAIPQGWTDSKVDFPPDAESLEEFAIPKDWVNSSRGAGKTTRAAAEQRAAAKHAAKKFAFVREHDWANPPLGVLGTSRFNAGAPKQFVDPVGPDYGVTPGKPSMVDAAVERAAAARVERIAAARELWPETDKAREKIVDPIGCSSRTFAILQKDNLINYVTFDGGDPKPYYQGREVIVDGDVEEVVLAASDRVVMREVQTCHVAGHSYSPSLAAAERLKRKTCPCSNPNCMAGFHCWG